MTKQSQMQYAEKDQDYWKQMGARSYLSGKCTEDCPSHITLTAQAAWLQGYVDEHNKAFEAMVTTNDLRLFRPSNDSQTDQTTTTRSDELAS